MSPEIDSYDLWEVVSRVDNVINFLMFFLAIVLTAVFWRRLGPASIVLSFTSIVLLAVDQIVVTAYVWDPSIWTDLGYDTTSALSIVSLLVRTLGVALLFVAMFVARGGRAKSAPPPAPAPGQFPGSPAPLSAPPAPYPGSPAPFSAPPAPYPGSPAPFSAPPAPAAGSPAPYPQPGAQTFGYPTYPSTPAAPVVPRPAAPTEADPYGSDRPYTPPQ